MKKLQSFTGILFALILFSCGQSEQGNKNRYATTPAPRQMTYEEQVKSVGEIEKENPLKFVKIEILTMRSQGFFSIDYYADFTIVNKATVAIYKDAVIEIIYESKTNTELSSENRTIYEYL